MFGFGKQSRTIIIDSDGNTLDETFDEHTSRQVVESLEALSQARIEVAQAMAQVRRESAKNKSNPHHQWAAALVGLSMDLSEAYDNLRGARGLEEAAYATAEARAGFQRWEELRVETGADVSDYQGLVPYGDCI
jgi:hypothetical protein